VYKESLTDWILDTQPRTAPLEAKALLRYLAAHRSELLSRLKSPMTGPTSIASTQGCAERRPQGSQSPPRELQTNACSCSMVFLPDYSTLGMTRRSARVAQRPTIAYATRPKTYVGKVAPSQGASPGNPSGGNPAMTR
jgi:hypothetical protein